jgi:CTP synthase
MIETTEIENLEDIKILLNDIDGIIVPGGFGNRGIEGKIKVIEYARKNNIPFLGICLGLQLAVIEFAKNVCNIKDATSEEFNKNSQNLIIKYLPGQSEITQMGGTLRLGSYEAILKEKSKVSKVYFDKLKVSERHRHRYEVNPEFHGILLKNGLDLSGLSKDGKLVEFISIENHPYFIATQSHPELKSKLEFPAPLFLGLIKAIISKKYKPIENTNKINL